MTANERLLRYDQEGVIQEEAKQPPPRTPAPGVQFFIYGPRLPWVDETKLKGVRPEEAFEDKAREHSHDVGDDETELKDARPEDVSEDAARQFEYEVGDYVVYPAHGVGRIEALETHSIAGMPVQLYAIRFEKERVTLKVPVSKARMSGLRKLSPEDRIKAELEIMAARSRGGPGRG